MGPPETALLVFVGLLVLALLLGVLSLSARARNRTSSIVSRPALRQTSVREAKSFPQVPQPARSKLELGPAERERYARGWAAVQVRFVEDPLRAVRDAERLTEDLIRACGYAIPAGEGAQHYEAARKLAEANDEEPIDTEELRQAIVHYRALVGEVLVGSETIQHFNEEARA